jgi:uncharacterized membrane protein YhaH (DUF805 family)
MWWFFWFIIGICYTCIVFKFSTDLDNELYKKGYTLKRKQIYFAVLMCFLWPITMFVPKFRDPDFYHNLKIKK